VALLRCAAAEEWHRREGKKSLADLDRIRDCLIGMPIQFITGPSDTLHSMFKGLWQMVRRTGLIELREEPAWPNAQEYVWGSVDWRRWLSDFGNKVPSVWEHLRHFGQVLTDSTPEELPAGLVGTTMELIPADLLRAQLT
jgi:hypothetical protein